MSTPDIKHVKVERIVVVADGSIVIHHTGGEYMVRPGDAWWFAMDAFCCTANEIDDLVVHVGEAGETVQLIMSYPDVRAALKAARGMREAAAAEQAGEPVEGVVTTFVPPWTHITADAEANVEVTNSAGRTLKLNQFGLFRVMYAASGADPSTAGITLGDDVAICAFITVEDCRRVVALIREAIASGEKRHLVRVL